MRTARASALGKGFELRDGRYVLERLLGTGGMAAVWLARDSTLDRPVAIKVLSDTLASDAGYVERFRREALLAARLSHPNLVKVFDFEPEPRPALIMEYVDGGTLDQADDDAETAIDPDALATQLLGALEHIHGAGIVHRDVKPGNVLIDDDGRAMLTDFGIAQPEDATKITKTGEVIGTLAYMAPEIQAGERATPQSDLYSTGVVLRDHIDGDASDSLHRLIERLTEPDPGLRPPSAKRALACLSGSGPRFAAPSDTAAAGTEEMDAFEWDPSWDEPDEDEAEERAVQQPAPRREYAIGIRHVLAGLALLAAAIVAIAIATSGGGSGDEGATPAADSGDSSGQKQPAGNADPTPPAEEADSETAASSAAPIPEPKPNADPAKGADLEQQAFQTLQSGDPEKAVKDYEKALAEFPADARTPEAFGQYPNYAYALYSYGDALLQVGRADEAAAVLEERLAFEDQQETVQALLEQARAEAGA